MAHDTKPVLLVKASHPRYLELVTVFGAPAAGYELQIPVTSFVPRCGVNETPRQAQEGGAQQFFLADRARLPAGVIERYARNIAGFFHIPLPQVLADLKAGGPMPILYLPEHMMAPAIPARMVL